MRTIDQLLLDLQPLLNSLKLGFPPYPLLAHNNFNQQLALIHLHTIVATIERHLVERGTWN